MLTSAPRGKRPVVEARPTGGAEKARTQIASRVAPSGGCGAAIDGHVLARTVPGRVPNAESERVGRSGRDLRQQVADTAPRRTAGRNGAQIDGSVTSLPRPVITPSPLSATAGLQPYTKTTRRSAPGIASSTPAGEPVHATRGGRPVELVDDFNPPSRGQWQQSMFPMGCMGWMMATAAPIRSGC